MNSVIKELVEYMNSGIVPLLLKEVIRTHGVRDSRTAIIKFLNWLASHSRLRQRFNQQEIFRPLSIKNRYEWELVLIGIVEDTSLSNLFVVGKNSIDFKSCISAQERNIIDNYVNDNLQIHVTVSRDTQIISQCIARILRMKARKNSC